MTVFNVPLTASGVGNQPIRTGFWPRSGPDRIFIGTTDRTGICPVGQVYPKGKFRTPHWCSDQPPFVFRIPSAAIPGHAPRKVTCRKFITACAASRGSSNLIILGTAPQNPFVILLAAMQRVRDVPLGEEPITAVRSGNQIASLNRFSRGRDCEPMSPRTNHVKRWLKLWDTHLWVRGCIFCRTQDVSKPESL